MSKDPNIIPPRSNGYIDPLEMARFLVLPGADKLLQAFSRIPPGALRESVIQHAEVIALTYSGAPAEQQMPDPLLTASQTSRPPAVAVLEAPKGRPAKTTEEQIVKLRLAGYDKAEIIEATGATRQKVEGVLSAARKASVKFPPTPKGDSLAQDHKTFITDMAAVSGQGRAAMEAAAAKRGHSLESYLQARVTFVAMRQAQKPMDEISKAVRIDEKTLWQWLYAARAAGIELATRVDYDDAVIEPVKPPEPVAELKPPRTPKARPLVIPGKQRVFIPVDDLQAGALQAVKDSAASRNLTLHAFDELREHIVLLRYNGMPASEISTRSGQDKQFVYNVLNNAQQKGVVFPPHTGAKPNGASPA
jgi:transposase-like protein